MKKIPLGIITHSAKIRLSMVLVRMVVDCCVRASQAMSVHGVIPRVAFPLGASLLAYGGAAHNKFTDMRFHLQRGTVFIISVICIAFVFFTVEFIVEKFLYSNDEVVDIIASVIGAFVFCRFKLFFEKVTDNIFFRSGYDYAEATARSSEAFSSTIDLRTLVIAIEAFLGTTIKPGWVDFFHKDTSAKKGFSTISEESSSAILDGNYAIMVENFFKEATGENMPVMQFPAITPIEKGAMHENSDAEVPVFGIGAIVPIFSHKRMNALLVLGRKKSGNAMNSHDKELLMVISRQIGMAVENAALYEAAKRHAEDLEQRVEERTERIKAMHEAQSKFLADMSHEFQTPLTILKMNVEVFAKKSGPERQKAAYVMEATLDRLSRLTRSLIDIARFNSFKEAFQKHQVSLKALLQETCDDCMILAKDRNVNLSSEGDDCFVLGDWDKLKEVLLNLVSNALKNTAAGGSVMLSAHRREGEVEITVTDSGKGIAPKNLPLIFERFYRINDGISEGAGLGLHLCRKIIEAHGGTIIAQSAVGQGSRFVIYLPSG